MRDNRKLLQGAVGLCLCLNQVVQCLNALVLRHQTSPRWLLGTFFFKDFVLNLFFALFFVFIEIIGYFAVVLVKGFDIVLGLVGARGRLHFEDSFVEVFFDVVFLLPFLELVEIAGFGNAVLRDNLLAGVDHLSRLRRGPSLPRRWWLLGLHHCDFWLTVVLMMIFNESED